MATKKTKTTKTAEKKTAEKKTAVKAEAAPAVKDEKTVAATAAAVAEENAAPAKTAKATKAVKAEEVKTEVKAEAAAVAEKKAPAKTTKKTSKAAEVKDDVVVEFAGVQVSIDEVVENVKKTFAAQGNTEAVKSVKIYLKPEDQAAYYVINDEIEGRMDVFFC